MFETVAPEQFARRSRKAFYEALPASLAIHLLIGGGAVAGQLWNVAFPNDSPRQVMAFSLAEIPASPAPPPPPPKPLATRAVAVREIAEMPREIVAPTFIPENIPVVTTESLVADVPGASLDGVAGGIEGGEIGGIIGGIIGGQVGGIIGGTPGGIVEPGRVTVERDKPLPMYTLSKVYPEYPNEARIRAWEDQLVVRYVIGKDGRVKEVSIISPPEREIFERATVRAIRQWRFRPLIKNGERQEVAHELTVYYRLNYSR